MLLERLDERTVLSSIAGAPNLNESVTTGFAADQLAAALVGPGVSISNATFSGNAVANGSFNFADPKVVGFSQGIILSSGNAADVVGPNSADWTGTDLGNSGDTQLSALAGYDTHDAAILEFDFTPTANQVVFNYSFASDEYPEWVNTPFNDVFAFTVNGTNYATVRQVAGDPNSPFVPVAVNNINDGNAIYPDFVPARPDLFRPNYYDPNGGPSAIDLEMDGITNVLTFQAPVNPGVPNHMRLAIADASDGIYDSAVFIQAGSIVSNEKPVSDVSLSPPSASTPLDVTANIEGEDPNGLPISYTIDWGDGTIENGNFLPSNENEKTGKASHSYASGGDYVVKVTVTNGTLSSTSSEDIHLGPANPPPVSNLSAPVVTANPADVSTMEGDLCVFTAAATGTPAPSVQWQVSTDNGATFSDIAGATDTAYSFVTSTADGGNLYQAAFTNSEGSAMSTAALLTVTAVTPAQPVVPDAPGVSLTEDTGASAADQVTNNGALTLSSVGDGATVEYSVDGGATWSTSFTPVEGVNEVLVKQTDAAGSESDATAFTFTLDTQSPANPDVTLANDSGSSASDGITNVGGLALSSVEDGGTIKYSVDGGATWSTSFTPNEGANDVLVKQTDAAGNASAATALSITLDTQAPTAPSLALAHDTGLSATDKITNIGDLTMSGAETGAAVEYSTDNGATWTDSFTAAEGGNNVQIRQTDAAGNVSAVTVFSFTLDTTAPQLNPTFSTTQPILVNAKGVTISTNAADATGIGSESAGSIDTSSAGKKTVVCTATDLAGNAATISVPYVVGYAAVKVSPQVGAPLKLKSSITVSFQLADANGVISDQAAMSLLSKVVVMFDGHKTQEVTYSKKTHSFSVTFKPNKPTAGPHTISIHVLTGGADIVAATVPVKLM
jgi:hypothetical protein